MSSTPIASTLADYRQGLVPLASLLRALIQCPQWLVPTKPSEDGTPGLWLFPGQGGEWWLCAFSDRPALDAYAQAHRITLGDSFFVAKGSSVVNNMPDGVMGLGLDLVSPHAVAIYSPDLPLLREFGQAFEVEAVLGRTSKRGNPFEILAQYPSYRVCWVGSELMMAPDPEGRRLAAVFTAEDTFQAFRSRHSGGPVPDAVKVDGMTLFTELRRAGIDGVVFNCAGPIEAKALSSAFCAAVLANVSGAGVSAAPDDGQMPNNATFLGALSPILAMLKPALEATLDDNTQRSSEAAAAAQAALPLAPAAPSPAATEPVEPAVPTALPAQPLAQTALPPDQGAEREAPKATLDDMLPRLVRQDARQRLPESAIWRPLLTPEAGGQDRPGPLVCFAATTGEWLVHATAEMLGNRSPQQLERQALVQLEASALELRVTTGEAATASYHGDHAAEAIVSAPKMRRLHEALRSELLAVAIPLRGVLIAVPSHHEAAVSRLGGTARRAFRAAGAEGLCEQPILVKDGRATELLAIASHDPPPEVPPALPSARGTPV